MTDFNKIFDDFKHIRAGVVGDLMLDSYWWGHVERISPEAPVPIVSLDKREHRIGGAGNVALNLSALNATVTIFSVTGNDEDAELLHGMLDKNRIRTGYLLKSNERITTNKARILSRNQQMIRVDSETTVDLTQEDEYLLIRNLKLFIENEKPQVIIFEDYNKGVLTANLIRELIALCKKYQVFTTVDPKRKNFFSYRGVDIFKPNLKEVREGLNLPIKDIDRAVLQGIHRQLAEKLGHQISLITLSENGIFWQQGEMAGIIPSHLRKVADVSGAGDTVIAVASLVYASTRDVPLMAAMANLAGGLVCEQVGTAPVDGDRLLEECKHLLS